MTSDKRKDNPGVIGFPPLIWAVSVAASLVVHFYVARVPMSTLRLGSGQILPRAVALGIGIALFMIAPMLAISAMVRFKKAGTNVHPSEPATTIVRDGPYRFTRNPMYLALTLLQIGVAFLLNDALTFLFAAALVVIFHFGVILREERYLEAKFGEEYLALKRTVRRWM